MSNERTSREGLAWSFGQLGRLHHAYGRLDSARTCYRNARRLDPEEFRWAYYLGHLARTEGELEASTMAFDAALRLRPDDVPTLVWLAENALDGRRLEKARRGFEAVLERDRSCVKALLGVARVGVQGGELEGAVPHLERAFVLQPEATEIHYALGFAYRGFGGGRTSAVVLRPHTLEPAQARRYRLR